MADKPAKMLFDEDNYRMYLNLINKLKLPYKITRSNYTMKIESEAVNAYFMQSVMSKKAFMCGAMIARDIKVAEKLGYVMPEIDRADLRYFSFNKAAILQATEGKTVYNIDIKSAYANALNNSNLLAQKTYCYLCSLSKKDRLAAVGMLAARKDVITYSPEGEALEHEIIIKVTENWFYFCVLEIQKVMTEIEKMIGDDFIFYWVDGVFFTGDHKEEIEAYLTGRGYKNSFDICANFKYFESDTKKYISYLKEGKEKILNMPKINNKFNQFFLKFFNLIK